MNKRQEKLLMIAGVGILAWIVWKNWFRKGSTSVEYAGSSPEGYAPEVTPAPTVDYSPYVMSAEQVHYGSGAPTEIRLTVPPLPRFSL